MQVEGSRMYRVAAVAAILDVEVSTIYRAIRTGALGAYKVGSRKGSALRIPGHAVTVYLRECARAACNDEGVGDPATNGDGELSPGSGPMSTPNGTPQPFTGDQRDAEMLDVGVSRVYRGAPTVEDGEELSPAQADGLACVVCGVDYLTVGVSRVPVGRSVTGSQVFACTGCTGGQPDRVCSAELVGEVPR